MKKNNLFAVFLALAVAICFSFAVVNAENGDQNENNYSGDEHRSAVSTFVQKLTDVADREGGGMGEQVKKIAKEQDDSKDNVAEAVDKVKNRNGFKTFLIGTDYKNIGQLRSAMVTTSNHIDQLTKLLSQTTDPADRATLQAQIQTLMQEQKKINDFITANENKFSLFGWIMKLFNKSPSENKNPENVTPENQKTSEDDVKIENDASGRHLTDNRGMSLYVFTNDVVNQNNCTGVCADIWPVFYAKDLTVSAPLSIASFGTITGNGKNQLVYKGQPLYYYSKDVNPGDVLGNGIGGVWFLAKP